VTACKTGGSSGDFKHNTLGKASDFEVGSSSVAPQDTAQDEAPSSGGRVRKQRKRKDTAQDDITPPVAKPKVHTVKPQQSTIDVDGGGSSAGFVLEPFVLSFGRWAGGSSASTLHFSPGLVSCEKGKVAHGRSLIVRFRSDCEINLRVRPPLKTAGTILT
jgi:hypothetical protein